MGGGPGWEFQAFAVPDVAGSPLETLGPGAALGAPPSRLLGDWPPSRLREALGRPRAEVTAAEFLPGRFPAPPQRPCQRGGREFTPARRNQGASPASISREVGLAGQPRPRTASGASSLAADLLWVSLPQVVTFLLLARVGGGGEPPVLLDRAQEPATSDFTLGLQELTKPRE